MYYSKEQAEMSAFFVSETFNIGNSKVFIPGKSEFLTF